MVKKPVDNEAVVAYKGGTVERGITEMDDLKSTLKQEARRHSKKLVKKICQVIDLPEIAIDGIHQEVLFATMDGYRATMKHNRNGDQHDTNETRGNR